MRPIVSWMALVALGVAALAAAGTEPSPFLDWFPVATGAAGPPYPTSPIQFEVVGVIPGSGAEPAIVPVEILNLSLIDARLGCPPDGTLPVQLVGSRVPPDDAFINPPKAHVAVLGWPPDPIIPPGALFDLQVDLGPLSGSNPRFSCPPDDTMPDPTHFDVLFDIEVDGGTASHTMRFAINPVQPFLFTDVQIGPPQSPAFSIGFQVTHDGSGDVFVPGETLFDVTVTGTFGELEVGVDIKPGSFPNCFNSDGHGVIPVAILGSETFDVVEVDTTTLLFDGLAVRVRGNRDPSCGLEDVNGDGFTDLVCHFEDEPDNWEPGEDVATITGGLVDGTGFIGSDSICIVP